MNQNFKKGDNVRLIDGLEVGKKYDGFTIMESMPFKGEAAITEVTDISCLIGCFYYPFSILERVEPC